MANNRDVKLTIRAKDEATAVIAKVTKALGEYGSGQDDLSRKIAPIGAKFKRLTDDVGGLQGALAKAKGQLAVSAQYKLLGDTVSKVVADFRNAGAAIRDNASALSESKSKLAAYTASRDSARKSLVDEKKALSESTRAIAQHSKGLASAKEASAKHTLEISKKEQALIQYRADLDRATGAQEKARQADEQAARTTEVLTGRLAELRVEREAQKRLLTGKAGMSAQYDAVSNAASVTPAMLPGSFTQSAAGSASVFAAEAEGDARSRLAAYDAEIGRIERLKDAASRAKQESASNLKSQSASVGNIEADIRKVYALKSAKDALAAANSDIATHSAALDKANAAQSRLAISTAKTEGELQDYSANIQASHNEVQKLESELRRLQNVQTSANDTFMAAQKALSTMNNEADANGFVKMERDVLETEKRIALLEKRLEAVADLSSRLSKYSDGAGGFTGADDAAKLRKLNEQFTQAKTDAATFRAEITRLKAELKTAGTNGAATKTEIKALSQALYAAETDARKLALGMKKIGTESGTMKKGLLATWRQHNAETRTALSIQQRIRGQILSMIAAYGGLYGVISMIRAVTDAYVKQEAALSRLGVVFDGNQERMSVELAWIRREANRLGIEFGTLADEYTKFAVAGKTSGFAEENIRRIFTSVSESARVNKLSLEEIKGVYLALSQMISKGKITAEELRQQLGERLPGAMKLMADAIGVSVSELDSMMKKGEVLASEDNMLKFAQKLEDTFGAQLPAALRMFTTEWGKLQNTIYNSRLLIGKGGLMDALTDAMKRINEYGNSKEGVTFFLALGNAMGSLVAWIPTLMENFQSIVKVIKILITLPIIGFFGRWIGSLKTFAIAIGVSISTIKGAPAAIAAMRAAMIANTSTMGAAAIAARGLGTALMTLGPLMAGMFVASMIFDFFGSWESGIDGLVEAQAQHARVMDGILAQYDEAKDKTYDWKTAVDEKNVVDLRGQIDNNKEQYENQIGRLTNAPYAEMSHYMDMPGFLEATGASLDDISEYRKQYKVIFDDLDGITKEKINSMVATIDSMSASIGDPKVKEYLYGIRKELINTLEAGNMNSQAILVLREFGDTVVDTMNFTYKFPTSMDEMANGTDAVVDALSAAEEAVNEKFIAPLENALREAGAFDAGVTALDLDKLITDPFTGGKTSIGEMLNSLNLLKAALPQMAQAFQTLAADGSLVKLEQSLAWMKNIPALAGILDKFIAGAYSAGFGDDLADFEKYKNFIGTGKGWMIRAYEGKINSAKQDTDEYGNPDKWRVGYGSDTVTDPETGKYRATTSTDIITDAQAEADLARRILNYIGDITSKIGQERWDSFNEEQQEVLLSIAHNYGTIPDRIIEVVKTGTPAEIAKAIRGEVKPGSINNGRRNEEAAVFERGGVPSSEPYLEAEEARREQAKKDAEDAKKEADRKQEDADKALQSKKDENLEIGQSLIIEQMRVDGKTKEAFIQEKINAYTQKHGALSKEELATLNEQYGKLFDLQSLKSKDEQTQEKIKEHQEEIGRLEAERNALLEQRDIFAERGDTERVAEINAELVGLNVELEAAIDRFILFWKSTNSPDAAAGIAQLEATKEKMKEVGKEAILTGQEVNERWAEGISGAFSSFAEAIANGENALDSFKNAFMQFAGEFLIEIGKMIVKQTMLNMLKNTGFGDGVMGALGSITTGIFHTGKAAGQGAGSMSRTVSPALFANAPRFHSGKLPGLRQGEMAAIIEQDEEVIPTSDPRHSWNQDTGAGAKGQRQGESDRTVVANFFDPVSFIESGLSKAPGTRVMMNFINANSTAIKRALEG